MDGSPELALHVDRVVAERDVEEVEFVGPRVFGGVQEGIAQPVEEVAHRGVPLRAAPGGAQEHLAAHRQLMLSALPIGAPFDWNTCHAMNDHAAAMCQRARGEERGD